MTVNEMLLLCLIDSEIHRVFPPWQRVLVGSNATFQCYSATNVEWNYESSFLPSNANVSTPRSINSKFMLTLINVTEANAGTYTCRGRTGKKDFKSDGVLEVSSKS